MLLVLDRFVAMYALLLMVRSVVLGVLLIIPRGQA